MRSTESTKPPKTGKAPPERPVPAPRGVTGKYSSWAKRRTAATSAVLPGNTTAAGG